MGLALGDHSRAGAGSSRVLRKPRKRVIPLSRNPETWVGLARGDHSRGAGSNQVLRKPRKRLIPLSRNPETCMDWRGGDHSRAGAGGQTALSMPLQPTGAGTRYRLAETPKAGTPMYRMPW